MTVAFVAFVSERTSATGDICRLCLLPLYGGDKETTPGGGHVG